MLLFKASSLSWRRHGEEDKVNGEEDKVKGEEDKVNGEEDKVNGVEGGRRAAVSFGI
jgi:hypothetical protein